MDNQLICQLSLSPPSLPGHASPFKRTTHTIRRHQVERNDITLRDVGHISTMIYDEIKQEEVRQSCWPIGYANAWETLLDTSEKGWPSLSIQVWTRFALYTLGGLHKVWIFQNSSSPVRSLFCFWLESLRKLFDGRVVGFTAEWTSSPGRPIAKLSNRLYTVLLAPIHLFRRVGLKEKTNKKEVEQSFRFFFWDVCHHRHLRLRIPRAVGSRQSCPNLYQKCPCM